MLKTRHPVLILPGTTGRNILKGAEKFTKGLTNMSKEELLQEIPIGQDTTHTPILLLLRHSQAAQQMVCEPMPAHAGLLILSQSLRWDIAGVHGRLRQHRPVLRKASAQRPAVDADNHRHKAYRQMVTDIPLKLMWQHVQMMDTICTLVLFAATNTQII